MEEKQYGNEAKYLKVIRNWRRAVDERGLPDATRQLFNKELLDFILDDLMPWHRTAGMRDFSLLEVNRYSVESSENYNLGGCVYIYVYTFCTINVVDASVIFFYCN